MKTPFFAFCVLLLLSACASQAPIPKETTPDNTATTTTALPPPVSLPITADKWHTWHCREGSRIETRLSANAQQLQLRYQGQEHTLKQSPSARPAIYENATLAFFSDGKSAAIGIPQSATLYASACQLGEH